MQSAETEETIHNDLLISLLEQDAVPMSSLHKKYGALLVNNGNEEYLTVGQRWVTICNNTPGQIFLCCLS